MECFQGELDGYEACHTPIAATDAHNADMKRQKTLCTLCDQLPVHKRIDMRPRSLCLETVQMSCCSDCATDFLPPPLVAIKAARL